MDIKSRLRVNLLTREIEIEGSEDFVKSYSVQIEPFLKLCADSNASVLQNAREVATVGSEHPGPKIRTQSSGARGSEINAKNDAAASKTPKKATGLKDIVRVNPELILIGDGNVPAFKALYAEKRPKSGPEFIAVTVYYLKELMNLESVTLSDAYTCYKEVGQRPSVNFKQAFIDTKNKKSWIDFDENGNLIMTGRGRIFVEHDLPPKKNGKRDSVGDDQSLFAA
jgi:hypothetical protein